MSSNSPKNRTNEFVFTTTTNFFVRFLGEFEDTKKSFRNAVNTKTNFTECKSSFCLAHNVCVTATIWNILRPVKWQGISVFYKLEKETLCVWVKLSSIALWVHMNEAIESIMHRIITFYCNFLRNDR